MDKYFLLLNLVTAIGLFFSLLAILQAAGVVEEELRWITKVKYRW